MSLADEITERNGMTRAAAGDRGAMVGVSLAQELLKPYLTGGRAAFEPLEAVTGRVWSGTLAVAGTLTGALAEDTADLGKANDTLSLLALKEIPFDPTNGLLP